MGVLPDQAQWTIRDHDGKFPELLDAVLADAGIKTVLTGVRVPRMNAIMERRVLTRRRELLDRIGWSVQMPTRRAAERDGNKIDRWREQVWPTVGRPRRTWAPGSASKTKPARG